MVKIGSGVDVLKQSTHTSPFTTISRLGLLPGCMAEVAGPRQSPYHPIPGVGIPVRLAVGEQTSKSSDAVCTWLVRILYQACARIGLD